MHNSKRRPNNDVEILWGRFSWRMLPALLQHYASTDTNKMQVTIEEAQGGWSWRSSILTKYSPVGRNIVRWNRRLTWNAYLLQTTCFEYKYWKFQCFSVLINNYDLICWEVQYDLICWKFTIQTIFDTKLSWRDPAVFQPFCCVSICWKFEYKQSLRPNHLKGIQLYSSHSVACRTSRKGKDSCHCDCTHPNTYFHNLIFWVGTWSSLRFQGISDCKLAIGQSHSESKPQNYWLGTCNVTHAGL